MKKLFTILGLFVLCTSAAFADDCGNNKDHGKGTPACKNSNGGNGGNGGSGGSGGQGGNSNVVVTNENLNQIKLTSSSTSNSTSVSNSASNSKSNSTSNSTSSATGGNATATGGNASSTQSQTAQGGNAVNAGNNQTTEFNQVHQVASAIAPDAYPTAPCRVSGSGAGSSPFFGVSFSGSKLDTECEKRETARSFALIGERQAALQILCDTNAAKKTKPTVCATIK